MLNDRNKLNWVNPLSWDLFDFWGFMREDDGEEDDWGFKEEEDIDLLCWYSTISCWEDITCWFVMKGI